MLAIFSKEFYVLVMAMLPVIELRGSIPLALALGIEPVRAFSYSIIGNLIPVIPLLLFLGPLSRALRHFKIADRFFSWVFARTRKRSALIQRYGFIGLIFFVSIPLPMTGAWTGTLASFLLQMNFWKTILAITLGVFIAGLLVTSASLGTIKMFSLGG